MDKLSCRNHVDSIMTSGFLWGVAGDNPKPVLSWDCGLSGPLHLLAPVLWPCQRLQPQDTVSLEH